MDNPTTTTTTTPDAISIITVIHCWSAPRSRSTALCYSFEARGDAFCVALDEPLYVAWLRKQSTQQRPYRDNLLQGIPPLDDDDDDDEATRQRWKRETLSLNERITLAVEQLLLRQRSSTNSNNNNNDDVGKRSLVIFAKEMAKFASEYDFVHEFQLPNTNSTSNNNNIQLVHQHLLLLRDPVAVVSSWAASGPVHGDDCKMSEIGLVDLLHIYSTLHSLGKPVTVLDSDELVTDPERVLQFTCDQLGINYQESM